ncbi:MAG TPA: glycosyltransferase family 4 protein [Bdellovibrionota bacterium]|nr:glycosyltransferase family 4 protein [Bdellovibrionota bacterium]
MRIAQVAPLFESVPPKKYGGTERIVSYLTEELVEQGHEVTLFASGDSVTRAKLIPGCAEGLRLGPGYAHHHFLHALLFEQVRQRAQDFDVFHFHTETLHFFLARTLKRPTVTTLHGRLDLIHLDRLLGEYRDLPLISISDAQRKPVPSANWARTIHHGLPQHLPEYEPKSGGYLAFLGRISPEKGLDRAIEIAAAAGLPLKIAAKVDPSEVHYYESVIRPLIQKHPNVEFVGELGDTLKFGFLKKARALLFPICWPEPFGLVLIEAMACGTPVVAFKNGSTPEIVEDGRNGFLVNTIEDAVQCVRSIDRVDREECRRIWEKRFSIKRCVASYVNVFEELIRRGTPESTQH